MFLDHKDDVPWYDAPAPPKRHPHYPQTVGLVRGELVKRCPCGAIGDGRGWVLLDKARVAPRRSLLDRLLRKN